MIVLVIATRNRHKVEEISAILGPAFRCLPLGDFPGAPEVAETALTFAGNATLKSVALAKWLSGLNPAPSSLSGQDRVFVLADDSGLEVDALNGAPGVHSARFAALDTGHPGNSATPDNNAKLLRLLREVPEPRRSGRFHCVLALTPVLPQTEARGASPACAADEFELQTELFDGVCEGRIGLEPHGEGGFGYDPLFVPTGYSQTFAELGESVKNGLSHRARALARLKARFNRAS